MEGSSDNRVYDYAYDTTTVPANIRMKESRGKKDRKDDNADDDFLSIRPYIHGRPDESSTHSYIEVIGDDQVIEGKYARKL